MKTPQVGRKVRVTLPDGKIVNFQKPSAASQTAAAPVQQVRITFPGGARRVVSIKPPAKSLVAVTLPGGRKVDLRLHPAKKG